MPVMEKVRTRGSTALDALGRAARRLRAIALLSARKLGPAALG